MHGLQHLFAPLVLAVMVLLTAAPNRVAKHRCVKLTRATIEKKLGKPRKCPSGINDVECFGDERVSVRVPFDSSGVAKSMKLFTSCYGIQSVTKVLDEILPKAARGKRDRRLAMIATPGGCRPINREEYECLRIESSQELCMGCAPASITVTWK
jgi:hypothetical protein